MKLGSVLPLQFQRSRFESLNKLDGVLSDLEAVELAELLLDLLLLLPQFDGIFLLSREGAWRSWSFFPRPTIGIGAWSSWIL